RPHTEVDDRLECFLLRCRPFNSRPHTEVDNMGLPGVRSRVPFNSRPHTEVDILSHPSLQLQGTLSTHDLTRRSTHYDEFVKHQHYIFNSRPHTEVDNMG